MDAQGSPVTNNSSIVNIVASGELDTGELDVSAIADDFDLTDYKVLPGRAYLKPNEIQPTIILFKSATFTVAGAKSDSEVREAVSWLTEQLLGIGIAVDAESVSESVEVRYMVVSGDLGSQVDLSKVVVALGLENSEYEPEQFPAVIYAPSEEECTVLIFSSGKLNVTGVESKDEADDVIEDIQSRLSTEFVLEGATQD